MAVTLKRNVAIGYNEYSSYIQEFEEKLIAIRDTIRNIYSSLSSAVMNPLYWNDDNALAFAQWFKANYNQQDTYESNFIIAKKVFNATVCDVCCLIKAIEPNTYLQYSYIKKYAGHQSVEEVITKLKNTNIATYTFYNQTKSSAKVQVDSKIVNTMYTNITDSTKQLQILADDLGKLVLAFGVGKKGVQITGLDCPANARQISRISVFSTSLKKKLDECILKTSGLEGIVNAIK